MIPEDYDFTVGDLVTLDPSHGTTRSCGIALWRAGILIGADAVPVQALKGKASKSETDGARAQRIGRRLVHWVGLRGGRPRSYVYEWPIVYSVEKSKGDQNYLLGLPAVGAELGARLDMVMSLQDVGMSVFSVEPDEWSGGVPKTTSGASGDPWLSPRGMRIASRLSPEEKALVPKSHDALDGVGIGLFVLGRFKPRRILPGCT